MVEDRDDPSKTPIPPTASSGFSASPNPSDESSESYTDLDQSDTLGEKLRRNLVNIGIIIIAIMLIFLMRACLLGHFFPSTGRGDQLATLEYLFNSVVHRNADEANFKKANLDQLLFENDALRTYENSNAEMLFEDGSLIRVDENTLIILKRIREGFLFGENRFALFMEQGGMILDLKPYEEYIGILNSPFGEVKVKVKAGALGLRLNLQILPDGTMRIASYSGDGVLEINGEKINLTQNQYIVIGKDLKPVVRLLPRSKILVFPHQEPIIFTRKVGQEVTFEWSMAEPGTNYIVELAQDEEFVHSITKSITPNSFFTDRIMGAGRYFWRVRKVTVEETPPDPNDPKTRPNPPTLKVQEDGEIVGNFLVVFDDPTAWEKLQIDPQRNIIDDKNRKTTVFFQADYPLVTFEWARQKGANNYRLEIFLDENFEILEMAKDLTRTRYSTEPGFFKHTQYFWQVIASNDNGDPVHVSDVLELKLVYDNALAYLTINEPSEDAVIETPTVEVSGVIPKEGTLFIQEKQFEIDSRGKFSGTVDIPKGSSQIIFKAIGEEDRIEYHIRNVTRP